MPKHGLPIDIYDYCSGLIVNVRQFRTIANESVNEFGCETFRERYCTSEHPNYNSSSMTILVTHGLKGIACVSADEGSYLLSVTRSVPIDRTRFGACLAAAFATGVKDFYKFAIVGATQSTKGTGIKTLPYRNQIESVYKTSKLNFTRLAY